MENQSNWDIIIIGSGPGAIMAAQTLVEAGKKVLMLDGGNKDEIYENLPGENDFLSLRQNDDKQFRYLLGDNFEAVPSPDVTTGAQMTPARKHIIKDVDKFCPVISDNFFPMESLAKGGLGAGWGLGAYVYNDAELKKSGLPIQEMRDAYQIIADRIGISCGDDELKPHIAQGILGLQPALKPDNSIGNLLERYKKKRNLFNSKNIFMGLPSMAILSQAKDERKANEYNDMDFYTDDGYSAWRPKITLDKLLKFENFSYQSRVYALSFEEVETSVKVKTINMENDTEQFYSAEKLILAAGALGSGRIAIRSLSIDTLPLLCNPYTYMPAINLKMIGKTLNKKKTSMAQAMMIYNPDSSDENIVSVALFTYRALLLMRLIQQSTLNIRDNRKIFKWLYPSFIIAGVHHPDFGHPNREMKLVADAESKTGDALKINFEISSEMELQINAGEKVVQKALRKLGVYPIKKLNPGFGSSIHYGGSLPVSKEEIIGTTSDIGQLHGTKNVFSADGASFGFLPAKGITLSIMANAHRVALKILENE